MPPKKNVLAMLNALKLDFLESISTRCFELERLILQASGREKHCSEFEEIFRIVHSLKGAGGTHGLPLVTSICHFFEDSLVKKDITHFDHDFTDFCLNLVDILHKISVSDGNEQGQELQAIYNDFMFFRSETQQHEANILVLEPSKMVSLLLQTVLEDLNLKPVLVPDSLVAMQRLLNEPFDIIIISVELALLKGPALISAVQLNGGVNAKTPVVLLTSQENYKVDFLSDVTVFFRSPKLAEQLVPHIKNLIENKKNKSS